MSIWLYRLSPTYRVRMKDLQVIAGLIVNNFTIQLLTASATRFGDSVDNLSAAVGELANALDARVDPTFSRPYEANIHEPDGYLECSQIVQARGLNERERGALVNLVFTRLRANGAAYEYEHQYPYGNHDDFLLLMTVKFRLS